LEFGFISSGYLTTKFSSSVHRQTDRSQTWTFDIIYVCADAYIYAAALQELPSSCAIVGVMVGEL
jgi:hypothetical protein